MSDNDSSDLSSVPSLSPPPVDDDSDVQLKKEGGILKFFHKVPKPSSQPKSKEMSPPRPQREPSPPHEYVLADNPDIAFIVMFRSKFTDVFPKNLSNFGPKELEGEIVDSVPGDRTEQFLCCLLKLLHNRQQDVKPGHYGRALEDAVKNNESAWPSSWAKTNPLAGGATFTSMTPVQRLDLLRHLILWTMSSSKTIKDKIDAAYKNKRQEEDVNQPLSVQPIGSDSDKRRYFLIEGNDDTSFRVYRESNPAGVKRTWWSVAGSIEDVHALTGKLLSEDGGPKAKKLVLKLQEQIPHWEESLEKQKRREYRMARKQQFKRPEPGFSLYEGRTRGKRVRYNYDDDDDDFLTDSTNRRSARNTGTHTPAEPAGPVVTASGRQIRAPPRLNVDTLSNGGGTTSGAHSAYDGDGDSEMKDDDSAADLGPTGRPRRSAAVHHGTNGWAPSSKKTRKADDDFDTEETDGSEPDFGDDEEEDEHVPGESEDDIEEEFEEDEDEDMEDGEGGGSSRTDGRRRPSLVIKLPVSAVLDETTGKWSKDESRTPKTPRDSAGNESAMEKSKPAARVSPDSPPEQTQDSISVAVKPLGSVKPVDSPAPAEVAIADEPKPPPTPASSSNGGNGSNGSSTASLAFRGSPEKPPHVPRPIDV